MSPVPAAAVDQLVPLLQETLVELVDLSLLSKQLHWCTQGGIAFLPVHRALDELVDFARDSYDTVAERIVQLGRFPDGRTRTVAAGSPLAQPDVAGIAPDVVPGLVVTNLVGVGMRLQARMDAAGPLDLVTQNIFIDVAQELGKLSWFWQASQGGN